MCAMVEIQMVFEKIKVLIETFSPENELCKGKKR
jgi:hypothetical protein